MDERTEPKLEIETIGVPKLSMLSKKDYNSFISILEFEIREFYKQENEKRQNSIKKVPP